MYTAILLFLLILGAVMLIVAANAFKRDGAPTLPDNQRQYVRKKAGEARITLEEVEH